MDIAYNWSFNNILAYPLHDGQENVICKVIYSLGASKDKNMYCINGFIDVTFNNGSTFIPFDDVTKEVLTSWVESAIGLDKLNLMKLQIEDQLLKMESKPEYVSLTPKF